VARARRSRASRRRDMGRRHARPAGALGGAGLGPRTASFSQCRRLTVASKRDGVTSCLRWDLDVLAARTDNSWALMEGPHKGSASLLAPLATCVAGTLVLWEALDRIVSKSFDEQDFLDLIDHIELHLRMVFHRYIAGSRPRLKLTINGRPLSSWDPFLSANSATWNSPIDRIPTDNGIVEVQCHVLPHQDRLAAADHAAAAGPEGWTAQQGFYVYRNERLLVAGSWLGLGRGRHWIKDEAHRLARIRLDISNTADESWKINVLKSTAQPPVAIRDRLTRLAEDTRTRARQVFAHRGQPRKAAAGGETVQAWRVEQFSAGVRYRIDRSHPAVHNLLKNAASLQPDVEVLLRVLEETIPVQRIWLDTVESRETPRVGFAGEPPAAIREVVRSMFNLLIKRSSLTPQEARERLLRTDPFNGYPDLVNAMVSDTEAR